MPNRPSDPVWTWGKAFKDGKLYCFEHRRALVARPRPDLRVWVKARCQSWRPTCRVADREIMGSIFPPGELPKLIEPVGPLAPLSETEERINRGIIREHLAFTAFFDSIPDGVRLEVI